MDKPEAQPAAATDTGTPFECVALLLQGGGALGAYQAGVYAALAEHGIHPTWISGISIGAINSAIIAGNPPERRVAKLRQFWEQISAANSWSLLTSGLPGLDAMRGWEGQLAAGGTLMQGVPGFFTPRMPPPPLQPRGTDAATSWYDTAPLRSTLERLVDFDRINAKTMRFSVGAVDVHTGNFTYFDNWRQKIHVEHVMASGALPPAFPAVKVGDAYFWDGGMVSNTPLDWVLSLRRDLDTLIFQVDLWSARGQLPADLADVATRMKDIQYSSRTRVAVDTFRRQQKLRTALNTLLSKAPPELLDTPEAKLLARETSPAAYNIALLIYRSAAYEGQSKDFAFSRQSMEEHWQAGRSDAEATLSHPEVLKLPPDPSEVRVFDYLRPNDERGGRKVD